MTVYKNMVVLLALAMIVLGVVLVARTLASGFGVGVVLGLLFVGAGAGRLWMLRRRG